MEELLKIALRGTANGAGGPLPNSVMPDASLTPPAGLATERTLLLAAGAWAVYRQAGHEPAVIPELPSPAPEETLPACSVAAARLLEGMLNGQHAALLPEGLALLRAAGQRMPYHLLPKALDVEAEPIRQALLPVLGARGHWLSPRNPLWQWAGAALPEDPTALEALWQCGTLPQRLAAIQRVRASDPALARRWIQDVWTSEKAEVRAPLLKAFEDGLSLDDEPFLVAALDDRAGAVRAGAALLLARLPGSALAQRAAARADAMLTATRAAPVGPLRLRVTPPASIDSTWQRDGIEPKPPAGMGQRAWWLLQAASMATLTHWQERFGTGPEEIISAVTNDEWEQPLLVGLAQAAVLHRAVPWAAAIWDRLWPRADAAGTGRAHAACRGLLALMRQAEAETRLGAIVSQTPNANAAGWVDVLFTRPGLWSNEFGRLVLRELRKHVASLPDSPAVFYDYWLKALGAAGRQLPPDCFAEALQPWVLPEREQWIVHQWRQILDTFTGAIRVRRDLRACLANMTVEGPANGIQP